jgi:hypothetical protein
MRVAELLLRGAGGEPVDFARTIVSHGVAELPPNRVALDTRTVETTLPVPGGARTVRMTAQGGKLFVDMLAGRGGVRVRDTLAATVTHMFRLDEDLSAFYAITCEDVELSWCAHGAGRMLRSPTVFEDVVKTTRTSIRTFLSRTLARAKALGAFGSRLQVREHAAGGALMETWGGNRLPAGARVGTRYRCDEALRVAADAPASPYCRNLAAPTLR